jgi:uncharacterized membrane protein
VSADRLSVAKGYNNEGGGWMKYEWNGGVWNLDDGECRVYIPHHRAHARCR